jgi:hypothetical protein
MSTPLFDFVHLIAQNDNALRAFVADPFGDPAAANLTVAQRTALISGDFNQLKAELQKESPDLVKQEEAKSSAAAAAGLAAKPQIGWSMIALEAKISLLKSGHP